ncbi:hypothetical protein [Singulisphaera sp. PoT]|uniref:hypothetical protein n=1 Tax=Singulisphaera sp. PoT TaxID=3411797 RepID=UPI003BF5A242
MLKALLLKLKSGFGSLAFAAGKFLAPPANAIQRELSRDDVKRVLTRAAIGFATGTGFTWDRIQAAFLRDAEVISTFWIPLGFAIASSIPEALSLYAYGSARPPEGRGDQP